MLKKVRKSELDHHQISLLDLLNNQQGNCKKVDIMHLFIPQHRQVFQLDYLYKSPHFQQYPSYLELVQLLQHFNQQTISLANSNNIANQIASSNTTKLACMRFLYRQMLSIAVMEEWQVKQNDFATKLKNWYYSLTCGHSFLQGINFKKRNQSRQEAIIQEDVRSKYISNVYDEINDYMRKKVDYCGHFRKDKLQSFVKINKNKNQSKSIDLPFIDTLLYKREDARMRNYREKQFQKSYFDTMIKNKNKLRESSSFKFKAITEHKQASLQKAASTNTTQQQFYPRVKRDATFELKSFKSKLAFGNKQNCNNRLSLNNINGINLINYRLE